MDFSRIIERWAAFQPTKPALHFQGTDVTYGELWARTEVLTMRLASLGVHAGDRVAWLGYNHPDLLATLFALARLGGVLVPLNFRLAKPELASILEHAEAGILIVDPDFYPTGEALSRDLPLVKMVGLRDAPKGWFAWDGPLPAGFDPKLRGNDSMPLMIVYTSGTTGRPKGAVHTQEAMLWNIVCSQHTHDFTPADTVLMPLPMFHVGGLCIQTLPCLHAGGTVIVHPRFDPGLWLADVAKKRPTVSLLVPATARAVVEHPQWKTTDISSLRVINMGSMVVPNPLLSAFVDRGVPALQVYGATETGPVSIVLRAEDAKRKLGSTGKPALHCEVRLVAPDGADVRQGEVGEIWIRGRNVMQGYWKDPTNPAFQEGWFRSGDLARTDEDGFYWVVGRSKDMIISGGENIYPAELENVLAECPDILEAAVVGRPDAKWGEVAVAVVVKKPGSALDERGVLALFDGRLARFKHPRQVLFAETLPKTALGKVQKADLVKQFGAV